MLIQPLCTHTIRMGKTEEKKQLKAPQTRRFDTFGRFDGVVQTVVSIHFKTLETLFELGF